MLNTTQCNATVNTTNNNDYFIDVTNLGLHNKDSTLVTQASIFSYIYIYIFYCDRMQDPVRSKVHSHNIPQRNSRRNRHN